MSDLPQAEIGILSGSGLYSLAGLEQVREVQVETPFGQPSDAVKVGRLESRSVAFLARHGAQHRLLPTDINYRANIFALKRLGVTRILSASAVGSMRENIHPRDVVLPDQFIDRTRHRASTFFGGGLVAHVSFSDPVCPEVRRVLYNAAASKGARAHDGGVYVCIEGPAFSTRAESHLYRRWGVDVIGMTNLQEAKLAREAEICYATLCLVTDYDCWHQEEEEVTVSAVLENLRANSELAASVLREAVAKVSVTRSACECGDALKYAIITPKEAVPVSVRERLRPIVGRYLEP